VPKTFLVAGTQTEVGKTWVTAGTIHVLRRLGHHARARKPVQSFEPGTGPTDAEILAAASGEDVSVVCPAHRWLSVPLAPPIAAQELGVDPFTIAELVNEMDVPDDGYLLVETAGGARSPLAADGDAVSLAGSLDPVGVILVADAGLGTINAVRLSHAAFGGWRVVVFLNRYDERDRTHATNLKWLKEVDGFDVVVDCEQLSARLIQEDR
jgi:dethiobiotin synthetase